MVVRSSAARCIRHAWNQVVGIEMKLRLTSSGVSINLNTTHTADRQNLAVADVS